MSTALDLTGNRLVICLGPGGVGKTTVAAALALEAAGNGRVVDVMTIDPAPRLLDALGLEMRPPVPREVPLRGLHARRGGRLRALMLDPTRMFDSLISQHAPSAAARDAILANRIYLGLSRALAGVADYMAAEQLLELRQAAGSDLIVLDTPPALDAIEFLEAPRRMIELLSSRALTLLGASREMMRGPGGIFDMAARAVLSAFDRLTGLHLLADVQAFVRSFEGMYGGFAQRAAEAQKLLRDPSSRIIIVTSAEPQRVDQVAEFIASLEQLGLRAGAMVVNRVMPPLPNAAEIDKSSLPVMVRRKLKRNLADFAALKAREGSWLEALRGLMPDGSPIVVASDLGYEPTTLKDLVAIAKSLRPAH
jgi:anion-transporting  ArsA/GET3 family ATPase